MKSRSRATGIAPRHGFTLAGALALLIASLSGVACAAPEDLDASFGAGGVLVLAEPKAEAIRVRAVPQGGWVIAVATRWLYDDPSYAAAGLWRVDAQGRPDPAFGEGRGFVHASTFCALPCELRDVVVTAEGLVLLIGQERVVRLTHEGAVDASFGTQGAGARPWWLADAVLTSIADAGDGGVFVTAYTNTVARAPIAWKLTRAGALDTTFGVVPLPLTLGTSAVSAVDVSGRLLVGEGTSLVRVRTYGALDPAFGQQGSSTALDGTGMQMRALELAPDGRILVLLDRTTSMGTTPDTRVLVAALRDGGSLDPAFGTAGFARVLTDRPGEDVVAGSLALDATGRMVVAGFAGELSFFPFTVQMKRAVVARFERDGRPDLLFAPGGSTAFWSGSLSEARHVAVAADGRIAVAGTQHDPPGWLGTTVDYRPRPALYVLNGGSTATPRPLHESLAIEYFHAGYGHYFMTTNPAEASGLDGSSEWTRTGASFKVWALGEGATPVCRFWSGQRFAPKSSHFYTPYADECTFLKQQGVWTYEADAFGLGMPLASRCASQQRPLYRAYNNGMSGAPNHRYATDTSLLDQMLAQGWIMEGDAATRVFACVPVPP